MVSPLNLLFYFSIILFNHLDISSTVPTVDFVVKIEEVNTKEREDALFECVLSHPLPRIKWMGKNSPLEDGEKYSITVSEDKLIHRLLVKDCMQLDKGIYTAVAGIKSCSAWLVVEGNIQYNTLIQNLYCNPAFTKPKVHLSHLTLSFRSLKTPWNGTPSMFCFHGLMCF